MARSRSAADTSTATTSRSTGKRTSSGSTTSGLQDQLVQPDPMHEAGEKASHAASQVADSARSTMTQQANTQKTRAAEGVSQLAQAMHRISGELRGQQPMIARVADTAAEQADRIGSYLHETDVADIVRATENFARRQPLIFFGGAFALGLAAARFIKASGGRQYYVERYGQRFERGYRPDLYPTGPGQSDLSTGSIGASPTVVGG